jgi:hypothetical protein
LRIWRAVSAAHRAQPRHAGLSPRGRVAYGGSVPSPAFPRFPRQRSIRLTVAALAAFAASALALTMLALPARADDHIDVEIGGVSGRINAGGFAFDDFRVTYSRGDEPYEGIQTVITIALDGMPGDAAHVQRFFGQDLPHEGGDGAVTFVDPTPFNLNNRDQQFTYFLGFGSNAPSGQASITVEAYLADGTRLGVAGASIEVRSGNPRSSPTTSAPPNTNPGYVPTFEAGPSYSLANLPQADTAPMVTAGVPTSLYVMGSLLMLLGLVVIALMFRRQYATTRIAASQSAAPLGALREPPSELRPYPSPAPTYGDPRTPPPAGRRPPSFMPRPVPRPEYPRDPGPGPAEPRRWRP